jgi:hypothetical protein
MASEVFFQTKYAWANNWGRVVGFDEQNLLCLDKDASTNQWKLEPIPANQIVRIQISEHRSIYLLILAFLAGAVAIFIAWMGIAGEITGPGVYTIPPILGFFLYWAITGSKFIKLSFEMIGKPLKYKSSPGSLEETRSATLKLIEWARRRQLAVLSNLSTQ